MSCALVVEDDPGLRRALVINLRAHGYDVVAAAGGAEALAEAARRPPDVVILDLGLPDMDGPEVIEGLRGWTRAPIVVLSARAAEPDKVHALDVGADDYVTKPFGMDELLARLRAALRRAPAGEELPVVETASFELDLAAKRATRDGADVHLTPTEWHLLEVLVRNEGKLVAQRQLLQDVWGPAYETETNYLRVYMAQLRRKLEPDPSHPRHLLTEPGMGYRFVKEKSSPERNNRPVLRLASALPRAGLQEPGHRWRQFKGFPMWSSSRGRHGSSRDWQRSPRWRCSARPW